MESNQTKMQNFSSGDEENQVKESDGTILNTKLRLENKLVTRLTRGELLERNILLSEVSPTLQATQRALNHKKMSDTLSRKLEKRPTHEQLQQRNILKTTKTVSGSLQLNQQLLMKQQLENNLSNKLSSRPSLDQLMNKHIIHIREESPEEFNESQEQKSDSIPE